MPVARRATEDDLPQLLSLFEASEVSAAAGEPEPIWQAMLNHPGLSIFVACADGAIVATATLISAPNLLRGGRGHGFLENVMTHPDYQGRGFGKAVVSAALSSAWQAGCHHVLLQSGRADPRVHKFYRSLGFEPGVREAYVAHAPIDERQEWP